MVLIIDTFIILYLCWAIFYLIMNIQPGFFLAMLFAGLFFACQSTDPGQLEAEAQQLINDGTMYHNRYCSLQQKTDSLWNIVAQAMEKGLPADFAPTDRSVFINSRNMDHITMFKSFKMIDTSLQTLVMEAGKKDIELANQVRALQTEMDAFESKKLAFLKKVASVNAKAEADFRTRLNKMVSDTCIAH